MNPATSLPAQNDYANFVALLADLTAAQNELAELESSLNQEHLVVVLHYRDRYATLQQRIADAEAAIQTITKRNEQWFAERKTIETPFGKVKSTPSTKLEIPNEAATIALIQAAKRGADFLAVETTIKKEALEALSDEELTKFGVTRVRKDNLKITSGQLTMGDAVADVERSEKATKKTVKRAAAAFGSN